MKVHRDIPGWEYWWDASWRTWCAMQVDGQGNQIGDCQYEYTRREIVDLIRVRTPTQE